MKEASFKKGEVIFREGEVGSSFYEIATGRVGIYVSYGADGEKKLTELGSGALFGEMAVVESAPRSATAVAAEDAVLLEVQGADLEVFLKEHPEKAVVILTNMSGRLRALTADYIAACGTIREMEHSAAGKRDEGLLSRIRKYIRDYDESQMVIARSYLYDSSLFY